MAGVVFALLGFWRPSLAQVFRGELNSSPGSIQVAVPGNEASEITTVAARPRPRKDGSWLCGCYNLVVSLKDGSTLSVPFFAADGTFHLSVIHLTPQYDWPEIVLIRHHAKGTNVASDKLTIYGVQKNSIKRLFSKRISGWFGVAAWWYNVNREFVFPNGRNAETALSLTLHHDPINLHWDEVPSLIPKVKKLCIMWFRGRIREYDGRTCSQLHPN